MQQQTGATRDPADGVVAVLYVDGPGGERNTGQRVAVRSCWKIEHRAVLTFFCHIVIFIVYSKPSIPAHLGNTGGGGGGAIGRVR